MPSSDEQRGDQVVHIAKLDGGAALPDLRQHGQHRRGGRELDALQIGAVDDDLLVDLRLRQSGGRSAARPRRAACRATAGRRRRLPRPRRPGGWAARVFRFGGGGSHDGGDTSYVMQYWMPVSSKSCWRFSRRKTSSSSIHTASLGSRRPASTAARSGVTSWSAPIDDQLVAGALEGVDHAQQQLGADHVDAAHVGGVERDRLMRPATAASAVRGA